MKLHQLLAILSKVKNDSAKAKTAIYHKVQKTPDLFKGLSRTYQPREDEGFVYPSESKTVQVNTEDLIRQFVDSCAEYFDLAATQDHANLEAIADIEVDGEVVLQQVPVSFLLFLEKQLVDVKTFAEQIPVLDSDQSWTYDPNRAVYATEPRQSVKTKKVSKAVVLYEATKEHPAQVREATEDIVEGTWTTIGFSSALPREETKEILARIDKLIKAVVIAREKANSIEVEQKAVAAPIFRYIFGGSRNLLN